MHINTPIHVGTVVTIKDGSHMLTICPTSNKLTSFPKIEGFNGSLAKLGHQYIVIAVNVPCPTEEDGTLQSLSTANNCIIKDLTNDIIWFCSKINLQTLENLL